MQIYDNLAKIILTILKEIDKNWCFDKHDCGIILLN